jgi:N6-L-threonylcarbamoyladenine synthase
MEGPDALTVLGKTLDDAAGEAFDKAGKMLGLPYPAGRHMDELASRGRAMPTVFPRPYLSTDSLNFSFSGIKTAMANYLSSHPGLAVRWSARGARPLLPEGESCEALADLCASYRLAIVETLAAKVRKAQEDEGMRDARGIVLAGGVASNSLLRRTMAELAAERGIRFFAPSPDLCTDNGVMIGYLGWLLAARGYRHSLDMEAVPRGKIIPDDMQLVEGMNA